MEDKTDKVMKFVEAEIKYLQKILNSKEPLLPAILRFHLLTEYQMDRIIEAKLPKGKILIKKGKFRYIQKVEIIRSLELFPKWVIESLQRLNALMRKYEYSILNLGKFDYFLLLPKDYELTTDSLSFG